MHESSSHKATKPRNFDPGRLEELARIVVDCGYQLHRAIGPGLLESAYELLFCAELKARGVSYECQLPVPVEHRGVLIENAFRADNLVEGCLLIELKSTEAHAASYKDGVRRIANDYYASR